MAVIWIWIKLGGGDKNFEERFAGGGHRRKFLDLMDFPVIEQHKFEFFSPNMVAYAGLKEDSSNILEKYKGL